MRICLEPLADNRCRSQSFPYAAPTSGDMLPAFRGEQRHAIDPQAETARYIDSLGAAELEKAHEYTVGGHWLLLWGLVVAAVVAWLIVRSGILDRLDARIPDRRRRCARSRYRIYLLSPRC